MKTEQHKGQALMYNTVTKKWYYYPEYTKGARSFKTIENAKKAIDKKA